MAASSLKEFIIDTLKEFYSRLSKKVGNVYITSYTAPDGERPFNTINDVYDWIRFYKKAGVELYTDDGKTHFAKCNDGSQYLLTSNIAEYESLVDPNRRVKVKQPAFKGKVIAKRVIPMTATPGSVYLVHPNTTIHGGDDYTWIPMRLGRAKENYVYYLSGNFDDRMDTSVVSGSAKCFIQKECMRTAMNEGDRVVFTGGDRNVFPIKLTEMDYTRWYLIKILKPLIKKETIFLDDEHIEIFPIQSSSYSFDTTCKLKFYHECLHYDEPSLYNGETFMEGTYFDINRSFAKCDVYTLKRTKRASRLCLKNDTINNYAYKNHCIFNAKIIGDKLIVYREEEEPTSETRPFTGTIDILLSPGANHYQITLDNSTDKTIEYPLSTTTINILQEKIVGVQAHANGEGDRAPQRFFYGVSEFKRNARRISRGYKKIGSAKEDSEYKSADYYTGKKSGKYLYYQKYRGVKSKIPAVLHVFKNYIRKDMWPSS